MNRYPTLRILWAPLKNNGPARRGDIISKLVVFCKKIYDNCVPVDE